MKKYYIALSLAALAGAVAAQSFIVTIRAKRPFSVSAVPGDTLVYISGAQTTVIYTVPATPPGTSTMTLTAQYMIQAQ